MFTNICKKVTHFWVCDWLVNFQYNEMCIREKTLLKWQSIVHMLVPVEFLPTFMFCTWQSGNHYTIKDCIQWIQHLEPTDMDRQL
jgi:hypothetical protein